MVETTGLEPVTTRLRGDNRLSFGDCSQMIDSRGLGALTD